MPEPTQAQAGQARQALECIEAQQAQVKQAIQGISLDYHPYDLESGVTRTADEVATNLEQRLAKIEQVVAEAQLGERSVQRIEKAKRVVVEMVATIAFFFFMIRAKVAALSLPPEVERAVHDNLIPAIYLHLVADKTSDAQKRHQLEETSQALLAPVLSPAGPFSYLTPADRSLIERVARECAELFQRSSSCVEGRNGQLALRHHSWHRLRNRKLAALTTVHNYFIKRSDGITAAERFFGSKPRDLFEWILERVDLPGRPAQKRARPEPRQFLVQSVA